MPQQGSKLKGNPAYKRIGNPRRVARRAACWARGKVNKDKRIAANKAAHKANERILAAGDLTAWQKAKDKRALRRATDQDVQRRKQALLEKV